MWVCSKYKATKKEWEELEVDGDSEFVAVMGKTKLDGEFRWE